MTCFFVFTAIHTPHFYPCRFELNPTVVTTKKQMRGHLPFQRGESFLLYQFVIFTLFFAALTALHLTATFTLCTFDAFQVFF